MILYIHHNQQFWINNETGKYGNIEFIFTVITSDRVVFGSMTNSRYNYTHIIYNIIHYRRFLVVGRDSSRYAATVADAAGS